MVKIICRIIYALKYKISRLLGVIYTKFQLVGNGVCYQRYRIVGSPIINVKAHGKITFGDNLMMNNGLLDNQIGFNSPCVFRAINGEITLGNNVGLSQATLVAYNADISVGNNVRIGGGVKIYTTDFHSLDYTLRRDYQIDAKNMKCAPVSIGDDCFIGAGTIILKGVQIGPRSVIGAGSVVTRNIPNDVVAGGNPCVVLRKINN